MACSKNIGLVPAQSELFSFFFYEEEGKYVFTDRHCHSNERESTTPGDG